MQASNDYARNTFRYAGFSTPFNEGDYYRVDEEVLSLYAMANLDFDLAGMPVTLNAGVRAVDTSVLSFGYHQVQNDDGSNGYTDTPISKDGSYNDVLPSLNMTMELADGVLLRAAASETLMRPALGDIAYKRSVAGVNSALKTATRILNRLRPSSGKPVWNGIWKTVVFWRRLTSGKKLTV